MKIIIKILVISIVMLVFLVVAADLFIVFKGKAILIEKLKEITKKEVTIDYLILKSPLGLEIKNIEVVGIVKADSVCIFPAITGLLTGNLALKELKFVRPEFTYIYQKPLSAPNTAPLNSNYTDNHNITQEKPPFDSSLPPKVMEIKQRPLRLIIKHINIKDGILHIFDRSVSEEGIKITIKDIFFDLDNLFLLPHSLVTNFALKGKIPWQQDATEGTIEAEGWFNLFKKDLRATLKIENIDGIYLYPYYQKWVDLEKARIQKAKLNFSSNIHGLNNDVTADCHLELTDVVFRPREPEEEVHKAEKIALVVLDIFKALNQGKIVLDFTIKTKMDKPAFGFHNIRSAFEDKLAQAKRYDRFGPEDILKLPAKLLEGAVKGATDVSKAVIDGTFAVGNEFKKAIEETFKKEKREE